MDNDAASSRQVIDTDNLDDGTEGQLDLRQYWGIIRQHWLGIVGLALMVSLLTALVVWPKTPIYQATASLLMEPKQAKILSIEDIYAADTNKNDYLQSQVEILKSRDLAKMAIEKLHLTDYPEFNPKPKAESSQFDWRKWLPIELPTSPPVEPNPTVSGESLTSPEEKLIPTFQSRLGIEVVRGTHIVKINFESADPELAMRTANTVGEVYIESGVNAKSELTQQATEWMSSRLEGLKEKLAQSDRNLQAFMEQQNLVDLEGIFTLTSKEIESTMASLAEARQTRAQVEGLHRQIQALGDDLHQNVDSIPEIYSDASTQALTNKLVELRTTESELSRHYGPLHPKMVSIRSEMESVERSFEKQVASLAESIKNRYESAKSNEMALGAALERSKRQIQELSKKQSQLRELQREVESNKNLYELFFNRLRETRETGDLQSANARFIDRAYKPTTPIKPKKRIIITTAFFASLVMGVLLAFLIDRLDNSFKDASDLENKLGVPLLGLVPFIKTARKGDKLNLADIFLKDSRSSFGESIRTVRTGVLLSSLDFPHKTMAVTSSLTGEGKSTIVLTLAFALAQMGKVLLIDADMRRPSIGKTLGFNSRAPGLSNLLAQTSEPAQCIQKYEDGKIDVIAAGANPPDPLQMLSSQRFADFVKEYEAIYDFILIDSPPVQAVSDALVISKLVKTMIYVVKAETTPIRAARDSVKRLRKSHAAICGVVLNQLDMEKAGRYGDYYAGYYYKQGYGYKEKA
ncbi:MAG: polysaccharide biosynthesis tyrosine autokinase [Proteobacteria bacterium]|nr:polysaccharide biosynthesis tyrosine autokinase [Pseudomonadota bacterium]